MKKNVVPYALRLKQFFSGKTLSSFWNLPLPKALRHLCTWNQTLFECDLHNVCFLCFLHNGSLTFHLIWVWEGGGITHPICERIKSHFFVRTGTLLTLILLKLVESSGKQSQGTADIRWTLRQGCQYEIWGQCYEALAGEYRKRKSMVSMGGGPPWEGTSREIVTALSSDSLLVRENEAPLFRKLQESIEIHSLNFLTSW